MRIPKSSRHGFTLVEVLVAAGLSILIMTVVTQAFQRGMQTLSQLKSIGELQQHLRSFESVMRTDLESEHFVSRSGPRVSDQRIEKLQGVTDPELVQWRPPTMGFFSIRQGSKSLPEGFDADQLVSTRASNHTLHMTVKRSGAQADKSFSTTLSPNMAAGWTNTMSSISLNQVATQGNAFVSDWAEVIYFLDTTQSIGTTPGGVPLYGLYRRTRVISNSGTPSLTSWTAATSAGMTAKDRSHCLGVSYSPQPANAGNNNVDHAMNSPRACRNPHNRLGGMAQNRVGMADFDTVSAEHFVDNSGNVQYTGADLLLGDVISFEVKANWDGGTLAPGGNDLALTYEYPFSDLPLQNRNQLLNGQRIYDTWFDDANGTWLRPDTNPGGVGTTNMIPQLMRVRAVQIKVRVWDRKNNMARQVTLIQDL